MRLYIRLLTILLLFPLVSTEAKENIEVFVHYTSTEGMSSDNIHDIAQDKHGFIWIATQYGLSRFDGQYFKNFLEKDYPSLLRNDFYHAYLLPYKEMTFAGGVIVSYNEETDSFDDLSENTQLYNFTSFSLLKDLNIIVTSDNDIFSYDSQKKKIHPLWGKNYSHRILDFWQDPYGRYWVGSDSGIFLLNKDGSIISKYEFMSHMNEMINNILPLDENHVFLCSTVGSLWLAEIDKNGQISPPTKMDTPFRNVSEALHDSKGQFWFGTLGNGLWKMSYSDDGKFLYRKIIPNNSKGEELSKISSLFEDSKGNIWIGTHNFGVWCLLSMDNIDSYTSTDLGLPKVKGSSFNEDENGNILFGTDGNGLFCLSHDYKTFKHYSEKDGLPCNNILT